MVGFDVLGCFVGCGCWLFGFWLGLGVGCTLVRGCFGLAVLGPVGGFWFGCLIACAAVIWIG